MRPKKEISIREIASISGVSVATVSRVINDNGRFSKETAQRVREVIDRYGYVANRTAKSLREAKSRTIGVIVPDITNELFAGVILEIENYFYEQDYSVIICNTNEESKKEQICFQTLQSKQVDGLICISGREELPRELLRRELPLVCIDRRPKTDLPVICVESDHYLGGYMATEALIAGGCKRILLLSWEKRLSVTEQRLQGYLDALRDYGIPRDEALIVPLNGASSSFEGARDLVVYYIKKKVPFDGIFATNDWRAYGALTALRQNKIDVPGQVKLIGFDGISVSKYCSPPISTVSQNQKALALEASALLYQWITSGEKPERALVTIPVGLALRGTV